MIVMSKSFVSKNGNLYLALSADRLASWVKIGKYYELRILLV